MPSIPKKAMNRGKNWLTANVLISLEKIQERLETLQSDQNSLDQKLKDIDGRVANAGNILISPDEIVTKIFSGLKIYLDPKDISVTPHLALDTIWEPHITKAWLSLVRPNDTVVMDIGANFGYFGALAAQITSRKTSKVVLFEANPKLMPYIQKTFSTNWLNDQSVIENLAVSDKNGEVTLNIMEDYIGSSSLHSLDTVNEFMHGSMPIRPKESVSVQAVTIDDYCKKHKIQAIDLIKMDIEGFEENAYQGMKNMVKKSSKLTFFVEFTKDGYSNPQAFYKQMLGDFGNVYTISDSGAIVKPKDTSYKYIVDSSDDWIMLIFSKNNNLAG